MLIMISTSFIFLRRVYTRLRGYNDDKTDIRWHLIDGKENSLTDNKKIIEEFCIKF